MSKNKREYNRNNTIVDDRLEQLVEMGKIEDTKTNKWLLYEQDYWDKFVDLCDDNIIECVLSTPQTGHWNGWLYAACEKRRGLKPNR